MATNNKTTNNKTTSSKAASSRTTGKKCRHENRELAFQVLYSLFFSEVTTLAELEERFRACVETASKDFANDISPLLLPDEPKEKKSKAKKGKDAQDAQDAETVEAPMAPEKPSGLAWDIVRGVWEHEAKLDALIARHSSRPLERVGRIELVILRMGAYELLAPENVDAKIILSEAIILAHDFGDDNAYQFINGILHSISSRAAGEKLTLASL